MNEYIDIVFDGPPGHVAGRFVETETPDGASTSIGEWLQRPDGYWVLRIPSPQVSQHKGVKVMVYDSTTRTDTVSVQIETDEATEGQEVRVMLNEGDLFIGDPNKDGHPWSEQVQDYYDSRRA